MFLQGDSTVIRLMIVHNSTCGVAYLQNLQASPQMFTTENKQFVLHEISTAV